MRNHAASPKRAPPRLATLPPIGAVPGKPASDTPITVMRGRAVRYAQSVRTEPVSAAPAIRVMRPSRFVPPGPRILHVRD
jgi:phage tail tape-measure protein